MSNIDDQTHAPPRTTPGFLCPEEQAARIAAVEHNRRSVAAALVAHGPTRALLEEQEKNRSFVVIQKASVPGGTRPDYVLGSLLLAGEHAESGDPAPLDQWLEEYRLIPAWVARQATGHQAEGVRIANARWRKSINRLITPFMPLVEKIARDCKVWSMEEGDKIQYGCLGLIEAAECVQSGRASFGHHARPYVHGAIAKAASTAYTYSESTVSLEDWDLPATPSTHLEPRDLTRLLDPLAFEERQLIVGLYGLYRHPDISARELANEAGVSFQRIYQLRNKVESALAQSAAEASKFTPDVAVAA